jgi:hypothetical protein
MGLFALFFKRGLLLIEDSTLKIQPADTEIKEKRGLFFY